MSELNAAADTTLARENATSLYRQIADRLLEEVEAGRYEPTGRLPSEAQLVERFGVSRVTVRQALDRLAAHGHVTRHRGKGTYASGAQIRHGLDTLRSFNESLRQQGLDASMRLVEKLRVPVPRLLQRRLAPATEALRLQRLHLVDGEPVALAVSYLPAQLDTFAWARVEATPAYTLIGEVFGAPPVRADISISALAAEAALAETLKTSTGAAVLVMDRSSYLADGRCCDCSKFYIRPERYAFVLSSTFRAGAAGPGR